MKLAVLTLLLTIACTAATHAQKGQKVLLRKIREASETERIRAYIDYGRWYEAYNLDSAASYYQKAGKLGFRLNNTDGIMDYYANYTYVLNLQGKLEMSRKLNLEALAIARRTKDPRLIANCLFNTGSSYNNSGEYEQAASYYIRSAKLFEQMNMEREMIVVNDNIGGVFTNIAQGRKGLPYAKKAVSNARKLGDSLLLAKTLINSSLAQAQTPNLSAARQNAIEGLRIAHLTNHPELEAIAFASISDIDFKRGQMEAGLKSARQAVTLSLGIDSRYGEMEGLKLLAKGYLGIQQYDSAVFYAERAIAFGNDYQFTNDHFRLYDQLASAYAGKGDFKNAYEAQSRSVELKDSIAQTQLNQKVRQLEARYQNFRNQRHISDLEQSATKNQLFIIVLLTALLILTLVTLMIYRDIRDKKKQAEVIAIARENEILQLEREKQLLAAEAVLKGQEEERSRIAGDLHDGLGGLLSGIKLTLLQKESPTVTERALDQLDNAVNEMRRIAHSTMPEALVRFGLSDALDDFCSDFNHSGLAVHLQVFGMKTRLDQNTEIMLYRVVQELVNNAVRHGKATEIFVQLVRNENTVSLAIEDNGSGFAPGKEGFGLKNVRSRVELLNGRIDIQSEAGVGTSVNIDIQLKHE